MGWSGPWRSPSTCGRPVTAVPAGPLVVNGVIGTETANSMTLRRAERQETTVLRRDIAEMHASGVSLMPEGVEKVLSPQDFADLLELLRLGRIQ